MNLGSRLLHAGLEVDLRDCNLDPLPDHTKYDVIGYSVLGPPYIPGVTAEIRELRARGFTGKVLVGGEGVARLAQSDFDTWFGTGCTRIRNISQDEYKQPVYDLEEALGLEPGTVPSMFETSMVAMLRQLSEERQKLYLTREFCLFLSQGCKFNCDFCIASKNTPETYRSHAALLDELEYVCARLAQWEHPALTCYISNLDAFQNPPKLEERLRRVEEVASRHGVTPNLRALATSRCTVEACRKDRNLPKRLRSYGLSIVAFGADGADKEAWKREHKAHNTLPELQEAFVSMREAGITTEFLMVIGFQSNPAMALIRAFRFSFEKAWHGAVIRPYLGKSKVPGNEHWERADPEVRNFLANPALLLRLDYAMLGSRETHPRLSQRWLSNAIYLAIIVALAPFDLCPTRPLVPVPTNGLKRHIAKAINRLMPFDR